MTQSRSPIETSLAEESHHAARHPGAKREVPLAAWARLAPRRLAIQSAYGNRTFGELDGNANRLARALQARGVGPGDGLALICTNRPEFVEVMYATERAGIRVTPVHLDLAPREAKYILDDCQAKAAIVDTGVDERFVDLVLQNDGLKVKLTIGEQRPGAESYDAALASASAQRFDCSRKGAPMFYTSGTTGAPKGIFRREALPSYATDFGQWIQLAPDRDLSLSCRMLNRSGVFGLSVKVPLASGVSVVMVTENDPETLLALIAQHRITYIYLVPVLLQRLLQLPEAVRSRYDLSSLRKIVHTGAPCPIHVKRGLIDWLGPIVHDLYGASEGGFTFISCEEWLRKPGSVGRVADHASVLDDNGNVLPAGEIGQVFFDAPEYGRFEYFNAPEKTRAAYCGDRYTLGDYGYVDGDGYLYLTGRTADVIVLGTALNVYPAEVETVLLEHPAVEGAAVYGAPHPELGEEVRALVQPAAGTTPDGALSAELIEHCRAGLAAFKCPSRIDFVNEIPTLPSGKVDRKLIRALRP